MSNNVLETTEQKEDRREYLNRTGGLEEKDARFVNECVTTCLP